MQSVSGPISQSVMRSYIFNVHPYLSQHDPIWLICLKMASNSSTNEIPNIPRKISETFRLVWFASRLPLVRGSLGSLQRNELWCFRKSYPLGQLSLASWSGWMCPWQQRLCGKPEKLMFYLWEGCFFKGNKIQVDSTFLPRKKMYKICVLLFSGKNMAKSWRKGMKKGSSFCNHYDWVWPLKHFDLEFSLVFVGED